MYILVIQIAVSFLFGVFAAGFEPQLIEHYNAMVETIKDLVRLFTEAGNAANEAEALRQGASRLANETEAVLGDLESRLNDSESVVEGEGLELLRQAIEHQQESGQQSDEMTKMARESIQLTDQ